MKKAELWISEDARIRCFLCSHRCMISEGQTGLCGIRKNHSGTLVSLNADKLCAMNADPIEKKPLFHFQPGTLTFSISAPGCNFKCDFCQNWQISQAKLDEFRTITYSGEDIATAAVNNNCQSIAYTYTEPTVFMELCADCGRAAKNRDLKNIFVSNGYMTAEAVDFAKDWLDAINIDLKAFREDFYQRHCKARLAPVLDTIKYIAQKTDIWLEITTLIIPGENDSDTELKEIAEFIVREAGSDVPWHVSRFYPNYKLNHHQPTPSKTLEKAYDIGKEAGLDFVYMGNLPGSHAESTFCSSCGKCVIERTGHRILETSIENGNCKFCGTQIAGVNIAYLG